MDKKHKIELPDDFFSFIQKYQEPQVDLSERNARLEALNPYLLTAEQTQFLATQQETAANERYSPWIRPILDANKTVYDASTSHSAEEVQQKYDTFQRLRSQYPLFEQPITPIDSQTRKNIDNLMYREYCAFMRNLTDNLSPELRKNPQEMLQVIKNFPVAFTKIDPTILTPEFVVEALKSNPDIYPTLVKNKMGFENVEELIQHPDVIAAYIESSMKGASALESKDLSAEEKSTIDMDTITTIPMTGHVPIHKINPLPLYETVCHKAFAGEGVYNTQAAPPDSYTLYKSKTATLGPTITLKALLEKTFPELKDQFVDIQKKVYNELREKVVPVSTIHESHLSAFAKEHSLQRPTHAFTKQQVSTADILPRPNLYDLTQGEQKLIMHFQKEHGSYVFPVRPYPIPEKIDASISPINTAQDFFEASKKLNQNLPTAGVRQNNAQLLEHLTPEMRCNAKEMLKMISKCPESFFKVDQSLYTPEFIAQAVKIEPKLYETIRRQHEGREFYLAAAEFAKQNFSSREQSLTSRDLQAFLRNGPTIYSTTIDADSLLNDPKVVEAYLEACLDKTFILDSRSCFDEQRLEHNTYITNIAVPDISPFCSLQQVSSDFYQKVSARAFAGNDAYTLNSEHGTGIMDREGIIGPAVVLREMIRAANPDRKEEFDQLDITAYQTMSKSVRPISQKHEQDLMAFAQQHSLKPPKHKFEQDNPTRKQERAETIEQEGPSGPWDNR